MNQINRMTIKNENLSNIWEFLDCQFVNLAPVFHFSGIIDRERERERVVGRRNIAEKILNTFIRLTENMVKKTGLHYVGKLTM